MRYLKPLIILLVFIFVSGCAAVSQHSFQKPVDHPLKKIALLDIPEIPVYHAMDWGNPGMMFGAVGGAIAGSQMNAETKQFNDLVVSNGQLSAKLFADRLTANLELLGYEIVPLAVNREDPYKLLESYDALTQYKVDAILDVVFAPMGVGYSTYNLFDRDFRPDVRVNINLVSKYTGKVIYSDVLMYGYHNPFMTATDLEAPKSFFYENFEALIANKEAAIQGLQSGMYAEADYIADALKQ